MIISLNNLFTRFFKPNNQLLFTNQTEIFSQNILQKNFIKNLYFKI